MASPERLLAVIFFIFKILIVNSASSSDFAISIPEVTITIGGSTSSKQVQHEQIVPLVFEQPSAPPQFEIQLPFLEQFAPPPYYFPSPQPYYMPPPPPPVIILNSGGGKKNSNWLLPLLLYLHGINKISNNRANYIPYYPYVYGNTMYNYDDRYKYYNDNRGNGVKIEIKRDNRVNDNKESDKGNVYENDNEDTEDQYIYYYDNRGQRPGSNSHTGGGSNVYGDGNREDNSDNGCEDRSVNGSEETGEGDSGNVEETGPVLFPTVSKEED